MRIPLLIGSACLLLWLLTSVGAGVGRVASPEAPTRGETVRAPGRSADDEESDVGAGAEPAAETPSAAPATLAVWVEKEWTWEPCPGAEVTVTDGAGISHSAAANDRGRALFSRVHPGRFFVVARASDSAAVESGFVPAGGRSQIILRPFAARELTGIVVREEDGSPIAGAEVRFWYPPVADWQDEGCPLLGPLETTCCDDGGRFLFRSLPCRFVVLRVAAPGLRARSVPLDLRSEISPRIEMIPGGSVEGIVATADGSPVAGATVTASPLSGPIEAEWIYWGGGHRSYSVLNPHGMDGEMALTTTTGSDGRYRLAGVALGLPCHVQAWKQGVGFASRKDAVFLTSREPDARLDLCLGEGEIPAPWAPEPTGRAPDSLGSERLEVRVVDERGERVTFGRLTLEPGGRSSHSRWGSHVFHGIPPGEYDVTFSDGIHGDESRRVTVPSRPVRLTVRRERGVFFTLVPPPGDEPPFYVDLELMYFGGPTYSGIVWREEHGARRVLSFRPDSGIESARLETNGYLPVELAVGPARGGLDDRGEVLLDRGESLTGRVVDDFGEPVDGAWVYVRPEEGGDQQDLSDREGRFRVRGLPPGRAKVTVSADRHAEIEEQSEVPGGTAHFTLARTVEVRVRIRDEMGHPVPRVRISAGRSRCFTDSTGAARLELPPGEHDLDAEGAVRTSIEVKKGSPPIDIAFEVPNPWWAGRR